MDKEIYAKLQNEYGDIHSIIFGGKEILYRALTFEEMAFLEKLSENETDLEDLFVKTAVVYPLNFDIDTIKAGHVSQLAQAIANISGSDIDFILSTLEAARTEVLENILVRIKAFIIAAMPVYSEEFLNSLNMKQLLEKLVLSEEILTIQQAVRGVKSENGIKLDLVPVDNPQENQTKRESKQRVDREELLRRISKEERQMTPASPVAALDTLADDILVKASGQVRSDDPIARKLHQMLGG